MRDLNSTLAAAIVATYTAPTYLVRLDLPGQTLRLSSRGTVTLDGESYTPGAQAGDLTDSAGGLLTMNVSVDNQDDALSSLFRSPDPRGSRVRVWIGDGDGPFTAATVELLIDGQIDAPSIGGVISCRAINAARRTEKTPRIRLLPPLCNHLSPPGTIIDWEGERTVLEGGA